MIDNILNIWIDEYKQHDRLIPQSEPRSRIQQVVAIDQQVRTCTTPIFVGLFPISSPSSSWVCFPQVGMFLVSCLGFWQSLCCLFGVGSFVRFTPRADGGWLFWMSVLMTFEEGKKRIAYVFIGWYLTYMFHKRAWGVGKDSLVLGFP